MTTESLSLPTTPEDLTTDWLAAALAAPGRPEVVGSEIVEVIWGTATKVLVSVEFATAAGADGPPSALCVKAGLDARLEGFDTTECYRLEAAFFSDLAGSLTARIPRGWFAASSESQGVVVLDDLRAAGCTFGSPLSPWSVDQVAAALEQMALWHGSPVTRPAWLTVGSESLRNASAVLLSEPHWEATFGAAGAPVLGSEVADRARVQAAIRRVWELDDAGPLAIAHGDAHVGNTYFDADGRPGFLDWQCVCLAPPLWDVAYFIGGALTVADRRTSERELLAHYLSAARAAGAPVPDDDGSAWQSYVDHTIHGFHWAVTPPVMQSPENVAAMAERYLTAIDDHGAVSAVLER